MSKSRTPGRIGSRALELAILIGLPIVCHVLFPIATLVPKPYGFMGIAVMLLGIGLMTWGSREFRGASAGYTLTRDSSVLVTSGLFRLTRNPMYLGMLVWLVGLAVILGSLVAFAFPLLFFGLANWIVIPMEERRMAEEFGEAYLQYRAGVRRWL